MRIPATVILALALAGCSDTVRTEFESLDDAKQAKAFDRGWLPPALPDGATEIVEVNDLDSNSGTGSFRFPPDAMPQYLETMATEHGAVVVRHSSGITMAVSNAGTHWRIELDPKNRTGVYSVQCR